MAAGELEEGALLNGRYKILRPLGRGGMGTVYLAEHVRLDTLVAVKEIRGNYADEEEYHAALQQREQEARTLVRLNHPNLPKVNDAFIENDRFYLIMEFIEGVTLEARLIERRGQPLNVNTVVEWGLQIADVLSYLHSLDPPIIFRDLKPSNVMVKPDGSIRLIDFGIARTFHPDAKKDTALLGSVGYSPPEQFGRNQTDPRSDIYAFGATLHHLLTGRDPSATPFKFPSARTLNPLVPESLAQLITQCLAMDADARPTTIHAVAMRLVAVREELETQTADITDANRALYPLSALVNAPSGAVRVSGKPNSLALPDSDTIKSSLSSNPLPPVSSGAIPTTKSSHSMAWLAVPVGLLLGVLMVGIWRTTMHSAKSGTLHTPIQTAPPIVTTPPAPVTPPTAPAPSEQKSDPNPPPTQMSPVEFTKIVSPGVVQDPQIGYLLEIDIAGRIQQQAGKAGVVTAFFYDQNEAPLPATTQNPDSRYVNSDGQLSVASALQGTGEDYPFATTLYVPLSQFPPAAFTMPLKIRSLVFFDGKRIAKSDVYSLPFLLPAPGSAPPSNPSQPTTPSRPSGKTAPIQVTPGRPGG